MSDAMNGNAGSELEEFYNTYAPKRFPTAKTKRAKQNVAKKIKLPLIRVGNSTLIDPRMGDNRLRELALHQLEQPRGRGRPRLIAR